MSIKDLAKITRVKILENSPSILSGLGIIGVFATAYLAVKATPKALKIIEENNLELKKDILKACWKEYLPSVAMSIFTSLCILRSNSINFKRNAALLSLYSLSETALRNYRTKVVEVMGAGKEIKVSDEIAKDHIHRNILSQEFIGCTTGEVLCYDQPSDRYFRSHIEMIRRKENEFNMRLRTEMQLTLNDLYYDLGLPPIAMGEHCGWDIEKELLTFEYSSHLTNEGNPCLVINYSISPLRI